MSDGFGSKEALAGLGAILFLLTTIVTTAVAVKLTNLNTEQVKQGKQLAAIEAILERSFIAVGPMTAHNEEG